MNKLRLKTLREAHRMTQADVASYLGYGVSYYAAIERGSRQTTQKTLVRLAELFKVDVDDLFERRGLPPKLDAIIGKVLATDGDVSDALVSIMTVALSLDPDALQILQQQATMLSRLDKIPR